MNLSLRDRVAAVFILGNIVVITLGFTVFHFLSSLNKQIENITVQSNRISLLSDDIRISSVSILKHQRKLLTSKAQPQQVQEIITLCEGLVHNLETLDSLYQETEIKKVIATMTGYVQSLQIILSKASIYRRDNVGLQSIADLADKILEAFTDFQDIQNLASSKRDDQIRQVIKEIKRHMMITLIIGFLGTILLAFIIPGKIALPFKKIKDAIRELQDCNFDVSIYYNQQDEIGEIAREMNKMITSLKRFEELRQDRINVEHRKFDALANLVKRPVLAATADGKLIYMNNKLYSLLQVQSDDVINKMMSDTLIPAPIIEAFNLAIKRRSKIENVEIDIPQKQLENSDEKASEAGESVFKGYANIIPVRGKDSSLDYYLMVMSREVFA